MESAVFCPEDGRYGVDIPKNVWHNIEALEPGSVIFEMLCCAPHKHSYVVPGFMLASN
jgi:hypothetical protein